ncbi:hypothetical protein DSUL_30111 [Desulfovibrionales bacterium]
MQRGALAAWYLVNVYESTCEKIKVATCYAIIFELCLMSTITYSIYVTYVPIAYCNKHLN